MNAISMAFAVTWRILCRLIFGLKQEVIWSQPKNYSGLLSVKKFLIMMCLTQHTPGAGCTKQKNLPESKLMCKVFGDCYNSIMMNFLLMLFMHTSLPITMRIRGMAVSMRNMEIMQKALQCSVVCGMESRLFTADRKCRTING